MKLITLEKQNNAILDLRETINTRIFAQYDGGFGGIPDVNGNRYNIAGGTYQLQTRMVDAHPLYNEALILTDPLDSTRIAIGCTEDAKFSCEVTLRGFGKAAIPRLQGQIWPLGDDVAYWLGYSSDLPENMLNITENI